MHLHPVHVVKLCVPAFSGGALPLEPAAATGAGNSEAVLPLPLRRRRRLFHFVAVAAVADPAAAAKAVRALFVCSSAEVFGQAIGGEGHAAEVYDEHLPRHDRNCACLLPGRATLAHAAAWPPPGLFSSFVKNTNF
ncbi:unnamed protein product, partial [Ectocarpus sp. 4 AP-2014]